MVLGAVTILAPLMRLSHDGAFARRYKRRRLTRADWLLLAAV